MYPPLETHVTQWRAADRRVKSAGEGCASVPLLPIRRAGAKVNNLVWTPKWWCSTNLVCMSDIGVCSRLQCRWHCHLVLSSAARSARRGKPLVSPWTYVDIVVRGVTICYDSSFSRQSIKSLEGLISANFFLFCRSFVLTMVIQLIDCPGVWCHCLCRVFWQCTILVVVCMTPVFKLWYTYHYWYDRYDRWYTMTKSYTSIHIYS